MHKPESIPVEPELGNASGGSSLYNAFILVLM